MITQGYFLAGNKCLRQFLLMLLGLERPPRASHRTDLLYVNCGAAHLHFFKAKKSVTKQLRFVQILPLSLNQPQALDVRGTARELQGVVEPVPGSLAPVCMT